MQKKEEKPKTKNQKLDSFEFANTYFLKFSWSIPEKENQMKSFIENYDDEATLISQI